MPTQPALSFAVSFHIWTNYRIGEESQSDYQIVEFRGQFPHLDKLQEREESQSDYQKFNIQCLIINKLY